MKIPTCSGKNKKTGQPCRSNNRIEKAKDGKMYCWSHHPEKRKEVRAFAKKGAAVQQKRPKARRIPKTPRTMADAAAYSAWIVDAIAHQRLDPTAGKAMTGALRQFVAATEKVELEGRIKDLEATIKKLRKAK